MIGSIFAGISCLAGWLLASSGDYNAEIVFFHRWSGIATFILALASYFWIRYRNYLFGVLLILIIVTGHYGSILTYGEGYFLKPTADSSATIQTKNRRSLKTEKVQGETKAYFYPYEDQIVPILKSRCYSCHSIQKKKGGLRLDSEFFIRNGFGVASFLFIKIFFLIGLYLILDLSASAAFTSCDDECSHILSSEPKNTGDNFPCFNNLSSIR